MQSPLIRYLKDIRFWIILLFIIRLYGIKLPPLEVSHNWRQTTVTMVARNFYENNSNIFYPQIDIAGEKSGITGMEFPLLNYTIYLISKIFDYQHWYGRLINLILSSIGIYYFYKLIKKYFTIEIAFNSTIVLLVSIWFSFSRKIMPDTFSVSFVIIGMYFGTEYLDNKNGFKNLLFFFLFSLFGMLSKLTAAYLLILYIPLLLKKYIPLTRKLVFCSTGFIFVFITLLWYQYWVPFLVQNFGFWHFFMGKSIFIGLEEILHNIPETLKRFYDSAIKYIGFLVFLFGIIQFVRNKNRQLIYLFSLSIIGFSFIILKSGFTFYHHNYYVIPFVPIMALICGYGLDQIKNNKISMMLLFSIGIEGVLTQQHDFFIRPEYRAIENLEKDLDLVSKREDLILINSGNYPTPMYFAHRKGWVDANENIQKAMYLESLKNKGLKYLVVLKKVFGTNISLTYPLVFENENYSIYKL
ncbi:MAG: glycosyltransferase family 39 protein [Saprospiraceae bacterium]|nr:glycosyltransferase family 39 protein [Saprospiraceae bacterium]MBK9720054.1 glycosyltransferase family 39 protein [Saprospiraceae bacterium]